MLVTTAPNASAAAPELLLDRARIGEFQGVRGDEFIAWQQNTRKRPDHFDVFARPIDGGSRFKVNAPGTNGANGGLDGDVLVYQEFEGLDSDLRFFNLVDRDRSSPPTRVNTPQWEYWPSLSGDRLLFGRLNRKNVRRIILFDVSSGVSKRLDKVQGEDAFLAPGQVNGDYAVWYKCSSDAECDVVLYHIATGTLEVIPNPSGRQRSPSVTPDGTVYLARSRGGCGRGVRIVRYPLGGPATVLWRLASGGDVGSTHAYVSPEGDTTLYYDHFACGQPAASDVWEIVEQGSLTLTVTLAGDGAGTVTSAPAGINCGSDCSEIYDLGTGVTLTATPQGSATFGGWGGACTGTSTTCTLTMDGPKSVTATFTTKPVLSVEKLGAGGGTVTSTPAGINCGSDCNEPYNEGTSITLTAAPNADSTFGGWGGACSGSGACVVTMNTSKSVTATFDLKPVLSVSTTGDGTVNIDPPDVDCSGECSEPYGPGTLVTLTATLGAATTVTWGGDCAGEMDLDCTVTMDIPRSVTATFV